MPEKTTIDRLYTIANNVWNAYASERWFHIEKDDAIQSAVMLCWQSLGKFDITRAGVNTYFSMICRHEMTNRNSQEQRRRLPGAVSMSSLLPSGMELGDTLEERPRRTDAEVIESRDAMYRVALAMSEMTLSDQEDLLAIANEGGTSALARRRGVSRAAGSKRARNTVTKVRELLTNNGQ